MTDTDRQIIAEACEAMRKVLVELAYGHALHVTDAKAVELRTQYERLWVLTSEVAA
jgi:hypothetical protein